MVHRKMLYVISGEIKLDINQECLAVRIMHLILCA